MHKCPHCGNKSFTIKNRIEIALLRRTVCKECQAQIKVPFWNVTDVLFMVIYFIIIFILEKGFNSLIVFISVVLLDTIVHFIYSPLVVRKDNINIDALSQIDINNNGNR